MTLAELYVYPVKSLAGLAVQQWPVDPFGLHHDRRWMLIDETGIAVTQRELPRMALIRPELAGDALRLHAPGQPALDVPPATGRGRSVQIWDDTVLAVDCAPRAAEWLSDFLGAAVSLVYMPDSTFRQANRAYVAAEQRVSFADAYPFLLISQESLDGLNERLERPIEMKRFRPNLVVRGADYAHAEDGWGRIRIGEIDFDVVKPCERCAIPTVDPATGLKGKEPTRTLATYRRKNGKVYFGQNLVHRQTGMLRVGAAATAGSAVKAAAGPAPD